MTATARRVQVETLSARTELLLVVRAAMVIAIGVWMYLASAASSGASGQGQRNLLPFQKLIADRTPEEQRTFRELQEGLLEAEATRAMTNAWPPPQALGDVGIPPFAVDPTQRQTYAWTLLQNKTIVNYIGIPKGGTGPEWLVLMLEPEPGIPPDQTFEDEEHHRLSSGAMLHVSTWVRTDGRASADRAVRLPQAEGWTQLYAVGPRTAQLPALVPSR